MHVQFFYSLLHAAPVKGAGRFEMRFQQIIAVVARRLNIAGAREISSVDAVAHAADLPLCMACDSPGIGMYSGSPLTLTQHLHRLGNLNPPAGERWLARFVEPGISKPKRLLPGKRQYGQAQRGTATVADTGCHHTDR